MRELRLIALAALFGIPLIGSATLGAQTRTETVNQALAALMLGTLPLLAAMIAWGDNLQGADADVRYGANRRHFTVKSLLRHIAILTVAALLATLITLALLRGPSDPLFVKDLVATSPVAIAASVCLACYFAAGKAWLGRGGVVVALLLTWLLGPLNLVIAVAVPTGHVRHLLGLGAELPLPAWGSFAVLYVMAAILTASLALRIPR